MIHVAGIDLSLTETGVTTYRQGSTPTIRTIKSNPDGPTLRDRRTRLRALAQKVIAAATEGMEDGERGLFVIEAPLYRVPMKRDPKTGENKPIVGGGHAHDRAGLWWLVVDALWKRGAVAEVAPLTLKRYATGSGSGRKAGVIAVLPRIFPDLPPISNDNAADGLVLAMMGARHLGSPFEPSPQWVTPAALDSVQWPA